MDCKVMTREVTEERSIEGGNLEILGTDLGQSEAKR